MSEPDPDWVADPSIAWRILLAADLASPLTADVAEHRLVRLHAEQGWPGTGTLRVGDDRVALLRQLGDERDGLVSIGLSDEGRHLIVSAHHSRVDGLGLLAVLAAMTDVPVSSTARGVGDRADRSGPLGTVVRRLVEVAASPPARILPLAPAHPDPLDVHVSVDLPAEVRTAALVVAGARGVAAHNRAVGGPHTRTRHVAVAVGVTREASAQPIADHSALLRLRDVEALDVDAVTDQLRHAPTQHAVGGSGGSAGIVRLGLRVLASRLGSTLLVSHLGKVQAHGIDSLTFHPVTAGGSGVSLGAVTLDGETPTTRLTLRARGSAWTHHGLEQLLEAVVVEIGR